MITQIGRVAAVAALGLATAACSSGAGHHPETTSPAAGNTVAATSGADGVQEVTINATNEFRFDPSTVTAHTGTVKVTLIDAGSYPHNLAVDSIQFTSDTVTGGLGHNTTTFMLTFSKPGKYPFVCTFHSSAGMRGLFVIS